MRWQAPQAVRRGGRELHGQRLLPQRLAHRGRGEAVAVGVGIGIGFRVVVGEVGRLVVLVVVLRLLVVRFVGLVRVVRFRHRRPGLRYRDPQHPLRSRVLGLRLVLAVHLIGRPARQEHP
ncbi:putative integral mebrane protein [Clavibacter sepedonicus]|uniref:Integral mebrane protein n=1 Tax=Clavibacter sepedonicus TaxID=31964 RepID=B0RHA8_CLASE|nr:putative integral mebrane protein [Clavibacter sepedonicus]